MNFYAHTLKTSKGENLFTFVEFANERLTAQEFARRTGASHTLADLAEIQLGWQPLSSHLINVAEQSCKLAEAFKLGEEGFLAGLLHDLGKYRRKFQLMLRGLEEEAPHAYAGSSVCQRGGSAGFMAASFAIGGHHAGLPNGMAVNKERIQRQENVAGPSMELVKTALADVKEQFDKTRGTHEADQLRRGIEHLQSFEGLYSLHKRRVYSLCLRMTGNTAEAEDLTQEAFLQLYRKISTFRGESAFSTWLHRLTVNVVLMHLRKKGLPSVSLEETLEPQQEDGPRKDIGARDNVLAGSIDRLNLERAIESLPPGYRIIFVLHDVEGYEHNEIAEMMGCSIGNSKSQLHKARLKLRDLLKSSRAERAVGR